MATAVTAGKRLPTRCKFFKGGGSTDLAEVVYAIGHRRRWQEAFALLRENFQYNVASRFSDQQAQKVLALFEDSQRLGAMAVDEFMATFGG